MPGSKDRVRLNKLQREAEGYLELGLPQLALDSLTRLHGSSATCSSTLYLKGEALRALGRWEEALSVLQEVAVLEPENIHVWLALGWCQKRMGRLDLAVRSLRRALEADPAEAILHYNLACYLSLAGKKREALERLSRALTLDPHYRDLIDGESDFDPLRDDPDFQALLTAMV